MGSITVIPCNAKMAGKSILVWDEMQRTTIEPSGAVRGKFE
jgi:hypothetical protein